LPTIYLGKLSHPKKYNKRGKHKTIRLEVFGREKPKTEKPGIDAVEKKKTI